MRWVKEIFPPRVRLSWLLMTTRLSASSFAGTARTLVAVGIVSEAFMFLTTAPADPRSGVVVPLPSSAAERAAGRAACEVLPAAGLLAGRSAGLAAGVAGAVVRDPESAARGLGTSRSV